jgi:hypothetical protein
MKKRICQFTLLTAIILSSLANGQEKGSSNKLTTCENLLRTKQVDAALQCYLQAVETDISNPKLNLRVCQILEAQGKVDQMEPYFSRLDKNNSDAAAFIDMLSLNYGNLNINCSGTGGCPFFFLGKARMTFTPPEDLEAAKAKRLSIINQDIKDGKLWFQKDKENGASTIIAYFPVVTSAPLPFTADIAGNSRNFDFNFISRASLDLTPADFDSIYCGIPDTMAELQVEVDDPDYVAHFNSIPSSSQLFIEDGRYYATRGGISSLEFQRKGRPTINKKYLLVTSIVITSAMILLQR